MTFSQRLGITPLTKPLQLEQIDIELKNGLWNVYDLYIIHEFAPPNTLHDQTTIEYCNTLWHNFFKQPIDKVPPYFSSAKDEIRTYFFTSNWYQVYNFIEFNVGLLDGGILHEVGLSRWDILNHFNVVLEREFAGYRFVNNILAPITNTSETMEIEEALSATKQFTSFNSSNIHLLEALSKISARENPDYRNSIKESISAVEAISKILSGNAKDSLAGAIDKIKRELNIHPALERGLKQIYGYTSDSGGIRHSMTAEDFSPDFVDAKFMLVSCSAFINYLILKADKAGIAF